MASLKSGITPVASASAATAVPEGMMFVSAASFSGRSFVPPRPTCELRTFLVMSASRFSL